MAFFNSVADVGEGNINFTVLRGEGGRRGSIKTGKALEKFQAITEIFRSFTDKVEEDIGTEL